MHTTQRAGAAALVLLAAFAALVALLGGTAEAGNAQFPPATTVPGFPPATTVPGFPTETTVPGGGVLVPSTTVAADPATTVAPGSTATPETEAPASDRGDPDAERTVWMAIAGLGVVALLIIVLTVVYARHTRPDRWHGGHDEWDEWETGGSDEDVFAPTAASSVFDGPKEDEQSFWWAED